MARRVAILQALAIIPTQAVTVSKAVLEPEKPGLMKRYIPRDLYQPTRSPLYRNDSRSDPDGTLNYALGESLYKSRTIVPYDKNIQQRKLDEENWDTGWDEYNACQIPVRVKAFGTVATVCTDSPKHKMLKYTNAYGHEPAKHLCDTMITKMEEHPWDNTWYKDQYLHMADGPGDMKILKWVKWGVDRYIAEVTAHGTSAVNSVKEMDAAASCIKAFGLLIRGNAEYFDQVGGIDFQADLLKVFNFEIARDTPACGDCLVNALNTWAFYQDSQKPSSDKSYSELDLFKSGLDKVDTSGTTTKSKVVFTGASGVGYTNQGLSAAYWNAMTSYVCHLKGVGSSFILKDLKQKGLIEVLERHNVAFPNSDVTTMIFHVLGCWTDTRPISEWITHDHDREDSLITLAHQVVEALNEANPDYWRCTWGLHLLKNILPLSPWLVQKVQNKGLMEGIVKVMNKWKVRNSPPFLPDLFAYATKAIYPAATQDPTSFQIAVDGDVPWKLVEAYETHEEEAKKVVCKTLQYFAETSKTAKDEMHAAKTVRSSPVPHHCLE